MKRGKSTYGIVGPIFLLRQPHMQEVGEGGEEQQWNTNTVILENTQRRRKKNKKRQRRA